MTDDRWLDRLLAPTTVTEFVTKHWRQSPLHICGAVDRFLEPFDDGFSVTLERIVADHSPELAARFVDKTGAHRNLTFRAKYFDAILSAGMSVCISDLNRYVPSLQERCREVARSLGITGVVYFNCYVAPQGGGFGTHFDTQEVFTLQLEGEKTWWYGSCPALAAPLFAITASSPGDWRRLTTEMPSERIHSPATTSYQQVTLRPGDLLYLPAGTWHRTRAENRTISLAMSIEHLAATDVILEVLKKRLSVRGEWRSRSIPRQPDDRFMRELRESLDDVRRALMDVGAKELQDLAMGIVERRSTGTAVPPRPPVFQVEKSDWFSILDPLNYAVEELERGPAVVIRANEFSVTIDVEARELLERLIAARTFRAADILTWKFEQLELDWDQVRELIRGLVDIGVLYPVQDAIKS